MATVKGVFVFNTTLTLPKFINLPTSGDFDFITVCEVNFTTGTGSLASSGLQIKKSEGKYYMYTIGSTSRHFFRYYQRDWPSYTARTIDFGTTEQTVSDDFYDWLIFNTTPRTVSTLVGTWVFDTSKILDLTMFESSSTTYSIDYTTNGLTSSNAVRSCSGTTINLYDAVFKCATENDVINTIYNSGWRSYYQNALSITVTGGTNATTKKLIEFFTANATRVVEVPTKIIYNELEIASIESGQTATLACAGNIIYSDIVIGFGAAGTITYNGTETAVDAGQTATLACAGKKMKTDVVVTL